MSSATTHSPEDIVRYALIAEGVGTLPSANGSWPIYAANEPSEPDNCITVFGTTGMVDGRNMIDGSLAVHDGFQARIRATTDAVGRAKAVAVLEAMAESIQQTPVTIGSNVYVVVAIVKIGSILPLGRENGTSRVLFTINAQVVLRQIT